MTTQGTETRQGQDLQGLGAKNDGPFGAADAPQPTDNAETIMTDVQQAVPVAQEADWIEHDGGECPVDPSAIVDLRFAGYDSIRVEPYVRYHEMWEQEADTVRWTWIMRQYGHHQSNVTHYRLSAARRLPCKSDEGADHGLGPHATVVDDCEDGFMSVAIVVGENVYLAQGGEQITMSREQFAEIAKTSTDATQTREAELAGFLEQILLYADPSGDGLYDGAGDIAGVKQNGALVLKGSFITICTRIRAALNAQEASA